MRGSRSSAKGDDYVWTLSKGEMRIYPNIGLSSISGSESFWGPSEIIWDPTKLAIGRQLDRRDLHLVDWDGDGACDIVWTDPDNNNRVQLWLNKYPSTGTWTWDYQSNPAPSLNCPERRGIGIHDLAVRFGDISGPYIPTPHTPFSTLLYVPDFSTDLNIYRSQETVEVIISAWRRTEGLGALSITAMTAGNRFPSSSLPREKTELIFASRM